MRREVILNSYHMAKATGDNNVYFIDGGTLFAGSASADCTVDSTHPNDLGLYRMAEKIGGLLQDILCK
ncbi:MAG: SGNH/GDSL hydrolase family protein [Bacteroidaceae bacterium]